MIAVACLSESLMRKVSVLRKIVFESRISWSESENLASSKMQTKQVICFILIKRDEIATMHSPSYWGTNVGIRSVIAGVRTTESCKFQKQAPKRSFLKHFSEKKNDNAILIIRGTYIYRETSNNYFFQRRTCSMHKHRHIVKPMIFVST